MPPFFRRPNRLAVAPHCQLGMCESCSEAPKLSLPATNPLCILYPLRSSHHYHSISLYISMSRSVARPTLICMVAIAAGRGHPGVEASLYTQSFFLIPAAGQAGCGGAHSVCTGAKRKMHQVGDQMLQCVRHYNGGSLWGIIDP